MKIEASAPKIALTPTTSGMALEIRPPNTKMSKTKVSGIEILSASAKSLEIFSFNVLEKTATPAAYNLRF